MDNNDKESTRYEKLLELNMCNDDKESTRYEKLLEEELTMRYQNNVCITFDNLIIPTDLHDTNLKMMQDARTLFLFLV